MSRLISAEGFYRYPSNERAFREDTHFINVSNNLFGVADGNSAAYSPKNPPLLYREGLTGGSMTASVFSSWGLETKFDSVERFVITANRRILREHQDKCKDPTKGNDVGGASFAACKLNDNKLDFIIGGDCFLAAQTKDGCKFWHGFDDAAFETEQADNMAGYAVCLEQTKTAEKPEGDKGLAWDMYYQKYQAKRLRCANRNVGQGGYASLNGDVELVDCWIKEEQIVSPEDTIILGTDGMLWADFRPDKDSRVFMETYLWAGLDGLLRLRDERDYLPHIGRGEYPEASAVMLKFK